MVSTASAVLPVWRSPITSCRWPRPIGVIESIALMPVCTGVSTLTRSTTPGATRSIGIVVVAWIGPWPSTGTPLASTTRPISASLTGIDAMRPVLLTNAPSSMWAYSPTITAPTSSGSRLRAMPCTPPGNSSSSVAITPDSPLRRAMPSPTDSTVPTSLASSGASKRSIFRRISRVIRSSLKLTASRPSDTAGRLSMPCIACHPAYPPPARAPSIASSLFLTLPSTIRSPMRTTAPPTMAGSTAKETPTSAPWVCSRVATKRRRSASSSG